MVENQKSFTRASFEPVDGVSNSLFEVDARGMFSLSCFGVRSELDPPTSLRLLPLQGEFGGSKVPLRIARAILTSGLGLRFAGEPLGLTYLIRYT